MNFEEDKKKTTQKCLEKITISNEMFCFAIFFFKGHNWLEKNISRKRFSFFLSINFGLLLNIWKKIILVSVTLHIYTLVFIPIGNTIRVSGCRHSFVRKYQVTGSCSMKMQWNEHILPFMVIELYCEISIWFYGIFSILCAHFAAWFMWINHLTQSHIFVATFSITW